MGGESVTISAYFPPSLVTVCHQNMQISKSSLLPPNGDIIFEWPLSQRGVPKFVHSDRGSQLVAAQKDLADKLKYDWDAISASTAKEGTT